MKYFLLLCLMCLSTLASPAKTPSSDEVKVISYNIRFANKKDGANIWQNRAKASPAMIKDYAPDVFGVQEALAVQLEYLDGKLSQYSFVGVGREDGKKKGMIYMFTPNINNENASYWVRFFHYSHLLITFEEKSIMGKTITITEDQLRKIVEVEVRFALAKAKFPIDGFSIVKHAVGSTDDSRNWSKYWEENHESHHFPSEPHICPSCLLLKDNFVGGHIVCKGITYIIPVCDTCNKEYKCSKAEEHPFYIKNEDMVRAPED